MIDVYATAGTFADPHRLATELATIVMEVEQVPNIPMFRTNTAAFVHELPAGAISNVDGAGDHVRVQVLSSRSPRASRRESLMPRPTRRSPTARGSCSPKRSPAAGA
jgi:hypothetical protein